MSGHEVAADVAGSNPFRALAETTPDSIITADARNHIVYANPAAAQLTGYSISELIGEPVTKIVPEHLRVQHRRGFERFVKTREAHLVGSMVTIDLLRADGTVVPIELSLGVTGEGDDVTLTALIRDVSEKLRRERLAAAQIAVTDVLTGREEEAQELRILAALTRALGWDIGILWVVDGDALRLEHLWQANAEATAAFAEASRQSRFALGRGAPGLAWRTRQPVWMEELRSQGAFVRDDAATADGVLSGVALPVVGEGRVIAVLELFTRSQEQFDDPLRGMLATVASQIGESLRRREHAAELARSNAELDHFASIVAHDLTDPLRTISGFAQLLLTRELDDAQRREFLEMISAGAERSQQILDGLLSLARVGGTAIDKRPVMLGAVVDNALSALRSRIEQTGADIRHEDLPTVIGDAALLGQVLQNLLANAVKFTEEGTRPQVRITSERIGEAWRIDIADNGRGIAPDQRVFGIFERSGRAEEVGLGLGLAICQRIVQRHGGGIWFDSTPGEGTTFHFTIPG